MYNISLDLKMDTYNMLVIVVNDNINNECFLYVIECDILYAYFSNIASFFVKVNNDFEKGTIKLRDYDKTVCEREVILKIEPS